MNHYVVFDTNALPVKGSLTTNFWVALFHLCETSGIRPALSEIALEETVNLRRETAATAIDDLVAALNRLSGLTDMTSTYVPTPDEVARAYREAISARVELLPLAGEHAVEALKREARRMSPARNGAGGRDSAIWLGVAALVHAGHTVYFITNNSKDFGKGSLHPELHGELDGAPGKLIYCHDPNEFISIIAEKVDAPKAEAAELAEAFHDSLRAQLITLVESVDSEEYSVERALDCEIELDEISFKSSYVLDAGGLALTAGKARFKDADNGAIWGEGTFTGWLAFDPDTATLNASEIDQLSLDLN